MEEDECRTAVSTALFEEDSDADGDRSLSMLAPLPLSPLAAELALRCLQFPAERRRSLPFSVTLSLPPVSLCIAPASRDVLRDRTLLSMPGIASSSQTEYGCGEAAGWTSGESPFKGREGTT